MEKQIQELKACIDNHITESGYYRSDIAKTMSINTQQHEDINKNIDELKIQVEKLVELYTAANFFRRFVIGTIAVVGTITGIVLGWIHILEKK